MNSADITGARSPLALQFDISETDEIPSVGEVSEASPSETSLSGETEAGILRFARFLKQASKDKKPQGRDKSFFVYKALQVYAKIQNSSEQEPCGAVLDKTV